MGFRKKKTLMDQAGDFVDQIRPAIESAVDTAKDKAGPLLSEARDLAVDARENAKPYLAQGKAIASDKAALGAALVADKAATGRDLATAKVAELKGEPPKKKGGKLKRILVVTGIAALAAFAYKKLTASDDSWQSSYAPAPPPATPAAPTPAAPTPPAEATDGATDGATSDDHGASSPDEALADAAEEPHEVTTPDDPAEVDEVGEGSHKA